MDQQNIDRLFREKLDQLEVTPSGKAWSQVEKQIRPQKTPMIYWVAASVSLFIITWMVWPDGSSQFQSLKPIASEVNHPVMPDLPKLVVPTVKENKDEPIKRQIKKLQSNQPVQPQFASNKEKEVNKDAIEEASVLELDTKTMVTMEEIEQPELIETIEETDTKPAFRKVKITYIASSDSNEASLNTQKADSAGVIKKFISFAEKIDPGDVLADIKTAKDNLLNGGLKSKKDRNSL